MLQSEVTGCKAETSWQKDRVEESCSTQGIQETESRGIVQEEGARDQSRQVHSFITCLDTPRNGLS